MRAALIDQAIRSGQWERPRMASELPRFEEMKGLGHLLEAKISRLNQQEAGRPSLPRFHDSHPQFAKVPWSFSVRSQEFLCDSSAVPLVCCSL